MQTIPASSYKFGSVDNGGETEYVYGDLWAREATTGPDRLVIAPARGQIQLLTELMKAMGPPYWILYVLLVSRTDATPGRYQAPQPMESEKTESFLLRFSEFFERDARQHVWVGAESSQDLLVYDHHNVIYAYGDLAKFERILELRGMQETEVIRFPCPHTHNYNAEFDRDERELLNLWNWKYFPLQDTDDL